MEDALFRQPKRKTGPAEAMLSKTLRAWARDGYLQGESWASARHGLRLLARNVDLAESDVVSGVMTPLQAQRVVTMFLEQLSAYRAGEEVTSGDAIDALIANISGPAVRD